MIKFFRNIRFRMTQSNKTRSYLLYAVGEIFLVVIGILIALQINNWNELSKTQESALSQLNIMADNIQDDLVQLQELNSAIDSTLHSGSTLLNQYKEVVPFDSLSTKYIMQMLFEQNLNSNKTAHSKLVSSGELSVLSEELQQAIAHYYILIERVREREVISNTFIKNTFEPHFFDYYSLYSRTGNLHPAIEVYYNNDQRPPVKLDSEYIKSDSKLEALTFGRLYQSKTQKEFYEKAIEQGQIVLDLIENNTKKS
ncbi:MAG: DUF6090 family protein [Flavobacteriaceae bacterium]|nr:DUF6090 family protein [Flavobacteriaceae bacterium]